MNKKPQILGWQGLSLLIPSVASAIGFFCFAVLAFSFTELGVLPAWFRTSLVLVGSFTLAFGSEIGTLSNVIEIYRKGDTKQLWDWIALVISVISTFGSFLLAFATLLGVKATWGESVKLYGPIALGLLAALDSYGNFLEFGLYLSSHDKRLEKWESSQHNESVKANESVKIDLDSIKDQILKEVLESVKADSQGSVNPDSEKGERVKAMLDIFKDNPLESVSNVAGDLDVSRATVYSYLRELESGGVIHRNGEGVQILEGAL